MKSLLKFASIRASLRSLRFALITPHAKILIRNLDRLLIQRKAMFLRLRTALYHAPDLAKAKSWYNSVLGIQPYVDEQFYVGFKVGDTELGLDPDATNTPGGDAGVVVYWAVADIHAVLSRLLELGATQRGKVQEMDSIRVATVFDPFGNILGLIQSSD